MKPTLTKKPASVAVQAAADAADLELEEDEDRNFGSYAIVWNDTKTHFTSKQISSGEPYHFYGWYRKTRSGQNEAHAIDIYAKRGGVDYAVDSVGYLERDPRLKMSTLNADICAVINRWFFTKLEGSFKTIDLLKKLADQPTIHINKIGTIDQIILKLKECRDVAIRCGGHRLVQMTGDGENDIPLNLTINVTAQALALEGKIPTLELGSMSDIVIEAGPQPRIGGNRPKPTINVPNIQNVKALVSRLKATDDKGEQRKIRAILRKMGHKGGARSLTTNRPKGNE